MRKAILFFTFLFSMESAAYVNVQSPRSNFNLSVEQTFNASELTSPYIAVRILHKNQGPHTYNQLQEGALVFGKMIHVKPLFHTYMKNAPKAPKTNPASFSWFEHLRLNQSLGYLRMDNLLDYQICIVLKSDRNAGLDSLIDYECKPMLDVVDLIDDDMQIAADFHLEASPTQQIHIELSSEI